MLAAARPLLLQAQPIKDTLAINAGDGGQYPAYNHLYIYKTDKKLTPAFVYDSLQRRQLTALYPLRSYNDIGSPANYYWLLLTIKNNLGHDEVFYYQLNHPQLYSVVAYEKKDTGFAYLGKSGYAYPFNEKMYSYYDNVFPLQIKQGQTVTVVLNINIYDGYNPFFAPRLSNTNTFKAQEQKFYMVNGIIAGIMLTAFLLNIFLGLSLKDRLHFLYAAYILCILYEIILTEGVDRQYFYAESARMPSVVRYIFPCAGIVLLAYIMQVFLNQQRGNSKLKIFVDAVNYCLVGETVLYCILFIFSLAGKQVTAVFQTSFASLATLQMLLVFFSAVEKAFQGNRLAWFYIAAILCIFTGILEYSLIFLGVNAAGASLIKEPNDLQTGMVVETLVVFVGIVYRYNMFKKDKEVLLTEINTHQSQLITSIVTAQEEERKRIAEDLHDDVGATLSALAMHISNVPENLKKNDALEKYYRQGLLLSNKAVGDIRTIAHNLLPKDFEATGLFKILAKRIEELNALCKVYFTLITEGDETILTKVFAITVYRIINELLTNILKHSMASEASLQVFVEDREIQIMCEDNGIGFDAETARGKGIGINNITGRVQFLKGGINTDSNTNGTTTVIHIPL